MGHAQDVSHILLQLIGKSVHAIVSRKEMSIYLCNVCIVTVESGHFSQSDHRLHLLHSNILFKKLNNQMCWWIKLEELSKNVKRFL